MQNILVPVGVSKYAKTTLSYAIDLASHFNCNIFVIDAYPAHSSLTILSNVNSRLEIKNVQRIKKMVASITTKKDQVKIVSSERDLVGTIRKLDQELGLDLIVTGPLNNEINEAVFLGKIAGSMIKRTEIPVIIAPLDKTFTPSKKMLLAFRTGEVKTSSTLNALIYFQDSFLASLKLLLVKVPGFANRNHQLNDELMQRSDQMLFSENATVYQGVLEHFQANQPDMLIVFKRERGFFEKLWETDIVFKKDFYCTIPLLILKNKD
ncbi:MAG: universal stress protein [Flavobacteriaceae bacterium]|jgi:nucleotide-binding universal stress UspA family protein|nr:universal stress protein [Flavobacteriaceae bacterium]